MAQSKRLHSLYQITELVEIKADSAFELIIGLETRPEIGHGACA